MPLARSSLKSSSSIARAPMRRVRSYTGPTTEVRALVLARDGQCVSCKGPVSELQHRVPRGAGGSSDPRINSASNLIAVCRSCHASMESWRNLARMYGYLVARGKDPATVPVLVSGVGWCLHDDAGGRERVMAP